MLQPDEEAAAQETRDRINAAKHDDKRLISFWLDPKVVKRFHILSAELGRYKASLITEALNDCFRKYEQKKAQGDLA